MDRSLRPWLIVTAVLLVAAPHVDAAFVVQGSTPYNAGTGSGTISYAGFLFTPTEDNPTWVDAIFGNGLTVEDVFGTGTNLTGTETAIAFYQIDTIFQSVGSLAIPSILTPFTGAGIVLASVGLANADTPLPASLFSQPLASTDITVNFASDLITFSDIALFPGFVDPSRIMVIASDAPGFGFTTASITPTSPGASLPVPNPEPGTWAMMSVGMFGAMLFSWRRRRHAVVPAAAA